MLSQQGLQFLPDVSGVLMRLHAFLKPHGRLAANRNRDRDLPDRLA